MDLVGGAGVEVGGLADRSELGFGHARANPVPDRLDAAIGELRAASHPLELLIGLDEPEAGVVGVEADDVERR